MVSYEELFLAGKVIRPHGLNGLLKIQAYARTSESFARGQDVYVKDAGGRFQEYEVLSIRPHKKTFLLEIKGIASIEKAEDLSGADLFLRRREVGDGEREEYFWYELIGLGVYLEDGRYLGTLERIIPTGANDIYVAREGQREFLIPAIADVVVRIDLTLKKMTIHEMEGLFDLNEV